MEVDFIMYGEKGIYAFEKNLPDILSVSVYKNTGLMAGKYQFPGTDSGR